MTHNKRQRLENGAGDGGSSHHRDEFLVTLDCYGTIKLSKAALQSFPASLLSITLLSDGIDDHTLYVPIGRGLESFPCLIKEIYDCGSPLHLPRLGLPFDLFVKWLKYLGLATAGRGLSIESEAGKRVSYFVETMLNTLKQDCVGMSVPCPGYQDYDVDCVEVPPDIKRHMYDLVPFEFARRCIHMSAEERPYRSVGKQDLNVSKLTKIPSDKTFMLKSCSSAPLAPGVVTGVYPFGAVESPSVRLRFKHGGHLYVLSSKEHEEDGHLYGRVELTQLDAGSCYVNSSQLESIIVVSNSGTDLLAEFKRGGMVYTEEKYGESVLDREYSADGETREHIPLIHGMKTGLENCDVAVLYNAYLLIVATNSHPALSFCWETQDSDHFGSIPWTIKLEELPAWALDRDGEAPVTG